MPRKPILVLLVAGSAAAVTAGCASGSSDQADRGRSSPKPSQSATTKLRSSGNRLVVAPDGAPAARGTYPTIARALADAKPGTTILLSRGVHGVAGQTTEIRARGTASRPITIRGETRSGSIVRGYVRVTGSHVRIRGLTFEGPTGMVQATSAANPGGEDVELAIMYGSDVTLSDSDVSSSKWHAGVFVDRATDVRILGNHIHDNGDRGNPANANLDHGIYWSSGTGLIAHNVVERNVAYGIQLYPRPAGVDVLDNTIRDNGRGGIIKVVGRGGGRIAGNRFAQTGTPDIKDYG